MENKILAFTQQQPRAALRWVSGPLEPASVRTGPRCLPKDHCRERSVKGTMGIVFLTHETISMTFLSVSVVPFSTEPAVLPIVHSLPLPCAGQMVLNNVLLNFITVLWTLHSLETPGF